MNRTEGHVRAVKREIEEGRMVPTKKIGMEIVNLDNFMMSFKDKSETKNKH